MKSRLSVLRFIGVLFTTMTICPAVACGTAQNIQATSLSFTENNLTIAIGERRTLKYAISPKAALNGTEYWFSSNEAVAFVRDGILVGVGAGTATISLVLSGLKADLKVTVIDTGGGGTTESIVLSTGTLKISVSNSATLKAYVSPAGSTVAWLSENPAIASVEDGKVTGVSVGTTKIKASLASGLSAYCTVTVINDSPTPGPTPGGGYTGSLTVGAPLAQREFMEKLLNEFNASTGSTVDFKVIQWEEDKGPDSLPAVLADGPDIYPYISDQTVRFYQRNALAELPMSSRSWIKTNMGDQAYQYATLAGTNKTIGYPFASDNGYVMYYSKKLAEACGISDMNNITMEDLLSKAAAKDYEVDFQMSGGFYGSGALMSYNQGVSMYNLSMKTGGTAYSVTSSFSSDAGVNAGVKIRDFYKYEGTLFNGSEAPGSSTLATIVDCSKTKAFKDVMGADYAVAPLPFIDETKTSRLGVFLGYKFYGINPGRAGDHIELAHAVAKFLVSEYAQSERLKELLVCPTLLSLKESAQSEPHIKALALQEASKGIFPLTAVDSKLWSNAETAILSIKALTSTGDALKNDVKKILQELDDSVEVE